MIARPAGGHGCFVQQEQRRARDRGRNVCVCLSHQNAFYVMCVAAHSCISSSGTGSSSTSMGCKGAYTCLRSQAGPGGVLLGTTTLCGTPPPADSGVITALFEGRRQRAPGAQLRAFEPAPYCCGGWWVAASPPWESSPQRIQAAAVPSPPARDGSNLHRSTSLHAGGHWDAIDRSVAFLLISSGQSGPRGNSRWLR